jgi:hypothetical protein
LPYATSWLHISAMLREKQPYGCLLSRPLFFSLIPV